MACQISPYGLESEKIRMLMNAIVCFCIQQLLKISL